MAPERQRSVTAFCENLTVTNWFGSVLPMLIRTRVSGAADWRRCYFVDASPVAAAVARVTGALIGVAVARLVFRLIDVRDEDGQLIRLRVAYQDIQDVQDAAAADEVFRGFVAAAGLSETETEYLAKCIGAISLIDRTTTWRALLLVQIAAWHVRKEALGPPVLFIERRPWQGVIDNYARRFQVTPMTVRPAFRWSESLRRWLGPSGVAALRAWRDRLGHARFLLGRGAGLREVVAAAPKVGDIAVRRGAQIAVEYLGQFNLNDPAYYSDLFFWQESSLDGRHLLLTFGMPQDPVDDQKLTVLNEHGIAAVALYPGAATESQVPIFSYAAPVARRSPARARDRATHHAAEWAWMQNRMEAYDVQRDYWKAFFSEAQVKVYVTWYRVDERIYPIADALRGLGGVTAVYQRSFQIDPNPEMSVDVELMFGFSPLDAEVERVSGSRIGYHVSVGYTADHRVEYSKPFAKQIRNDLLANGARRVIAYFDENSANDSRWHTGHEFMRENYVAVLEHLLADSTLGLVLKPKRPSSLRRRLAEVAPLLERALATGRCHICETGPLHGSFPPVVAALAADLVVHGHLCGSTAGLEAALAGVPTLLLDREGWPKSMMYGLERGRVVFTNWTDLWRAVEEHMARPGGVPGFGDWQPMIGQLDPFRDGRAAQRMGNYLDAVIRGLRAGRDRDDVLADAAQQYAAVWGADKVSQVDGRRAVGTADRHRFRRSDHVTQ